MAENVGPKAFLGHKGLAAPIYARVAMVVLPRVKVTSGAEFKPPLVPESVPKASSLLGYGLSQVEELQQYAADSGRAIIANSELHVLLSAAPCCRLLPAWDRL